MHGWMVISFKKSSCDFTIGAGCHSRFQICRFRRQSHVNGDKLPANDLRSSEMGPAKAPAAVAEHAADLALAGQRLHDRA